MLTQELIQLANMIMRLKAESQTIEVKAANKCFPQQLYDTLTSFSSQDSGRSGP